MNKTLMIFALSALFFLPSAVFAAEEGGELRITPSGNVSMKGAKVFQTAGTTFFVRIYWKDVFLRATIITDTKTSIIKRYGETASAADLKEGDIIDVEGSFPNSAEVLLVQARSIVNHSLQKEALTTKGTVVSVSPESDEFKMRTWRGTLITVTASGASMKKGIIPVNVAKLAAGDRILEVSGTYDFSTKTLAASSIDVWQDSSVFAPHNFQGKIKSISGTSFPAEITVALTKKDYVVSIGAETALMNKNREPVSLSRFLVGDTVRFYGAIREDDLDRVYKVEIFRNMSL